MPSVYNKNRVTKKGYNLLAESIATKKPVTFTKVVIGDGDDNGLNIDTMINVVSEKLILPVLDGQKDGDGQYLVTAVLSNSTVETGFFPKEVALFAKCGDGEEILYSYSNGGNNVGLIPDKNTPINSEIYNIRTKIGNATNITFVTSDDTYVTKGELTKHNTDEQAHDNRFNAIIQQVNTMITTTDDALIEHRESSLIDHPDGSITTPKIRDKSVTLKKLADEVVGTILKKSDIKVITGEVANGGTIPLPDGFLESECKWFAGIKHSNVKEWRIDIEEGNRSNLLAPMCTLNGRVVTVGTQVAGLDGGSYTEDGPINFGSAWTRAFMPGTAWYMCIGIHG